MTVPANVGIWLLLNTPGWSRQCRRIHRSIMPAVRDGTSPTRPRRVSTWLAIGVLVAVLLVGAYRYLDRQFRLAAAGGGRPRLAATDQPALRSMLAGDAAVSRLQAAGRILSIPPLTRLKVLWSDGHSPCRGPRDFAVRVQILEGPRRGQAAWLCFEDLQWPLDPLP
jgi:hypothetical protein